LYRENGKATHRSRSRWKVKDKWVIEKQAEQKIAYRSVPVEGYYIAVLSYYIAVLRYSINPFHCKKY
jgi:hypothetical protein